MTQDIAEPGSPEPGPDTFDFEAWLDEKSTFPVFDHIAYVDQKSGAKLAALYDEVEELVAEQGALDKQIQQRNQDNSISFVDMQLDRMLADRERIDERLTELMDQRDGLQTAIKESAITLTFQVKTPEELGTVTREATREFHKSNKQWANGGKEDDADYVTARMRHLLVAQVVHFCTGMKLSTGREVAPPTKAGAEKLLRLLISSELVRFMESIATGLSASQEWADKLDAGFPGGSADVENVELDQDGAQGGEVVGAAPDDNADRQALDLGRREEPQAGHGGHDLGGGDLQGVRDSGLDRDVDQ